MVFLAGEKYTQRLGNKINTVYLFLLEIELLSYFVYQSVISGV
jgi:hypothetical protein